MFEHTNKNIGCTVTDCKHHAVSEQFCSLNKINVVDNKTPACTKECTDCASFEPKNM